MAEEKNVLIRLLRTLPSAHQKRGGTFFLTGLQLMKETKKNNFGFIFKLVTLNLKLLFFGT